MKYLFYLEPYSFIFSGNERYLVYNTVNSAYIQVPNHPVVYKMLQKLENPDNGYCIVLTERELRISEVCAFVSEVRESFSGDYVYFSTSSHKPFIFKPSLYMNYNILKDVESEKDNAGNMVLHNLNEITLFLPVKCEKKCEYCGSYQKQIKHCYLSNGDFLKLGEYIDILNKIHFFGVSKLNIVSSGDICFLKAIISNIKINTSVYISLQNYSKDIEVLSNDNVKIFVYIKAENIIDELDKIKSIRHDDNIKFVFLVSSKNELDLIIDTCVNNAWKINIYPFYNGGNIDFFREYVFNNIQDIILNPIDRNTIYRRQILNENFFGGLFIDSIGDVFSNMNTKSIGNIRDVSLKEIVYRELVNKDSIWLKTRNNVFPCFNCVNKYLCPSVSNYELAMGKYDLCDMENLFKV